MTKHIASTSGGKDSTYMLHELVRRNYPLDEAVFFDTGWEFPQMYEHMSRLIEFCNIHGITFTALHPENDFDYLMLEKVVTEKSGETHCGYSWCGLCGCRWGTSEKLKALDKYCEDAIVYVGIAADETARIERKHKPNKQFPLAEWEITETECLAGCHSFGYDWGGLYEHLDRVSCKFCALKNLKELRNIRTFYPDVWEELKQRQLLTNRPYKGEGKSVFQLDARFTFEEKRLAVGMRITGKEFFAQLKEIINAVR